LTMADRAPLRDSLRHLYPLLARAITLTANVLPFCLVDVFT